MPGAPFIIEDKRNPGLFLGGTGWTRHRPSALEFIGQPGAEYWLEDAQRRTPALLADRTPKVVQHEMKPGDVMPGLMRPVESDWDPIAREIGS